MTGVHVSSGDFLQPVGTGIGSSLPFPSYLNPRISVNTGVYTARVKIGTFFIKPKLTFEINISFSVSSPSTISLFASTINIGMFL